MQSTLEVQSIIMGTKTHSTSTMQYGGKSNARIQQQKQSNSWHSIGLSYITQQNLQELHWTQCDLMEF